MPEQRPNPFATRFTRPGALPYIFLHERENAATLVERLRAAQWRGQIVGPHGSGKSTLLAALQRPLEDAGRTWLHVALHDGQRTLPAGFPPRDEMGSRAQIVVDGYEQLGRFARWRLAWLCRRNRCGLLVTSHEDSGLPTVFRTQPTLELARRLVRELWPAAEGRLSQAEIAAQYEAHRGDLREFLFAMYDRYQRDGN